VASASIVERLQEIAAQGNQNNGSKNGIEKRPVGVSNGNKSYPIKTVGPRFVDGQNSQCSVANTNRGRAGPIMPRGAAIMNTGITSSRESNYNYTQNKRTSNPDIASSYTGKNEERSILNPLAYQSAARRFSSDMRMTDINNSNRGILNPQIIPNHPGLNNTQPNALNLPGTNTKGFIGILICHKAITKYNSWKPSTYNNFNALYNVLLREKHG